LELNAKLRMFAVNCSLLYGGHNTVQAQLKFKSKRRQSPRIFIKISIHMPMIYVPEIVAENQYQKNARK